jgi:hypothetical protein
MSVRMARSPGYPEAKRSCPGISSGHDRKEPFAMIARLHPALRTTTALTLLGALYLACFAIARSSAMQVQPTVVSVALLVDLTVTAGAICYLLLVRPGTLPGLALIPLLLLGPFTASRILPEEQQGVLVVLGVVWAVAELAIAGAAIVRGRRLVRATRAARRRGEAPWPALAAGLTEILGHPRIAEVVAQEAIATYYALAGWLRRPRSADGATIFTHHRSHAWGAVVLALVVLSVPEGLGIHFLIQRWSATAAVIASGLHVYGLLWLIGDHQYMRHTAIALGADGLLRIDIGFRLHLEMRIDDIAAIGATRDVIEGAEHLLEAKVMGDANVFVRLHASRMATVLLGRRRQVSGLAMRVDDPEALIRAVHVRTPDQAQLW